MSKSPSIYDTLRTVPQNSLQSLDVLDDLWAERKVARGGRRHMIEAGIDRFARLRDYLQSREACR